MNKVILMDGVFRDPEVRYSQGEKSTAVARYTLAVNRRFKKNGEPEADFIGCVAFGRTAEFAEKYFRKGLKVIITGRIQTGSYTNKEGNKVYTTDIFVEDQEFAESKKDSQQNAGTTTNEDRPPELPADKDGFMMLPEDIDERCHFNYWRKD